MEDQELVQQILNGDQKAVSLFYRRFREPLLAAVSEKVDFGVAEELVQEIFLSALQSLPLFSGKSSLYSWLLGIARHEVCDYYRKRKIKEVVFSKLPFLKRLVSQALSPETAFEEKELKEKIKSSLGKLSEGYRRILRLRYIDGCSVADLALKLGISYKSAESKLFRARLAFQKIYSQSQADHQNHSFNHAA